MKRVGLVMHATRPDAVEVGEQLVRLLLDRGVEVHASPADAARLASPDVVAAQTFPEGADLVFSLGGDGTLLRAVHLVHPHGIPLLGVNLGRLGFLSEVERAEVGPSLARVLEDGFTVEERTMLQAEIHEPDAVNEVFALNDIIIGKIEIGRAITLEVAIDGEPFIAWSADGVIVSTATGSTAYSLSAGGPIVSPRLNVMLLTPVAPHGLFDRTVVIPPDEEILIRVVPDPDAAVLSADGGPGLPLSSGASVRVRAGGRLRLAKVEPTPFWALVREKFRLPLSR